MFSTTLAGIGGPEGFVAFWGKRDPAYVKSAEFRKVSETRRRFKNYVDPGSPGRNWNDAVALVIQGKAGMQIMGDWLGLIALLITICFVIVVYGCHLDGGVANETSPVGYARHLR